jgi:hypothetical protein
MDGGLRTLKVTGLQFCGLVQVGMRKNSHCIPAALIMGSSANVTNVGERRLPTLIRRMEGIVTVLLMSSNDAERQQNLSANRVGWGSIQFVYNKREKGVGLDWYLKTEGRGRI